MLIHVHAGDKVKNVSNVRIVEKREAMSEGQTTDHKKVAEFYDNVYYRDASIQARNEPSRHFYRLAERIGVMAGNWVLDIACGTGDWLKIVAGRKGIPSGIDISSLTITIQRNTCP